MNSASPMIVAEGSDHRVCANCGRTVDVWLFWVHVDTGETECEIAEFGDDDG